MADGARFDLREDKQNLFVRRFGPIFRRIRPLFAFPGTPKGSKMLRASIAAAAVGYSLGVGRLKPLSRYQRATCCWIRFQNWTQILDFGNLSKVFWHGLNILIFFRSQNAEPMDFLAQLGRGVPILRTAEPPLSDWRLDSCRLHQPMLIKFNWIWPTI